MAEYVYRSEQPASREALYTWHARPGAVERLLPPWMELELLEREGAGEGDRVVLDCRVGPRRIRWVARHEAPAPPARIALTQEEGPFASWRRTQSFAEGGAMEDRVRYEPPLGGLIAGRIRAELERVFRFRHRRAREDLLRGAAHADRPRLTVAITGASGLVGRQLTAFLRAGGHRVIPAVRRAARLGELRWSTEAGLLEPERAGALDAVIHLAGANLAEAPWTGARKAELVRSRVEGTAALARSLAALPRPPGVLISASAVGYYGDRGDSPLNEDSPRGEGFLAALCERWEAACEPAREAGIRVVNPRIGAVLTAAGGALRTMLLPAAAGLGGPLGSGRQVLSWVAMDDVLGGLLHALYCPELSGPVNLVAPTPVSQRALARTLGRVLGRPAILPVPAAALRLVAGRELAQELLLAGARVMPSRLQGSGFHFSYPELEGWLRMTLGRLPADLTATRGHTR